MENEKIYKIMVHENIYNVYACSIYHAIDKLYFKLYEIEKDRNKYKLIK
jgi:hypothetical protein